MIAKVLDGYTAREVCVEVTFVLYEEWMWLTTSALM